MNPMLEYQLQQTRRQFFGDCGLRLADSWLDGETGILAPGLCAQLFGGQ